MIPKSWQLATAVQLQPVQSGPVSSLFAVLWTGLLNSTWHYLSWATLLGGIQSGVTRLCQVFSLIPAHRWTRPPSSSCYWHLLRLFDVHVPSWPPSWDPPWNGQRVDIHYIITLLSDKPIPPCCIHDTLWARKCIWSQHWEHDINYRYPYSRKYLTTAIPQPASHHSSIVHSGNAQVGWDAPLANPSTPGLSFSPMESPLGDPICNVQVGWYVPTSSANLSSPC